jgi:hypothetical protein
VKTEGTAAPAPQTAVSATILAWLELLKPVPVTCTSHFTVIGQLNVRTSGPFSLNVPTSNM